MDPNHKGSPKSVDGDSDDSVPSGSLFAYPDQMDLSPIHERPKVAKYLTIGAQIWSLATAIAIDKTPLFPGFYETSLQVVLVGIGFDAMIAEKLTKELKRDKGDPLGLWLVLLRMHFNCCESWKTKVFFRW